MKSFRITLAALLSVLVLAACANADTGRGEPSPDEPSPSEPSPSEPSPSEPSPSEPTSSETPQPAVVREAIADLARRSGADPSEITLVSLEEVTWSDGSLGCAEKGKMYTQALVEGSRVVLRVDGAVHEYHASNQGQPFLCRQPTE